MWIIERVLAKDRSMNHLAEMNLFHSYELNCLSPTRITAGEFTAAQRDARVRNFIKMSRVWPFSLNLQLRYLLPCHESLINNLAGFLTYLRAIHSKHFGFIRNGSEELRTCFGDTLIKLLKICLFEIIRIHNSSKVVPQSELNTESCLIDLGGLIVSPVNFDDVYGSVGFETLSADARNKIVYSTKFSNQVDLLMAAYVCLLRFIKSDVLGGGGVNDVVNSAQIKSIDYMCKQILSVNLKSSVNHVLSMSLRANLLNRTGVGLHTDYPDPVNIQFVYYLLTEGKQSPDEPIPGGQSTVLNHMSFHRDIKCEDLICMLVQNGAHQYNSGTQNGPRETVQQKYEALFKTRFRLLLNLLKYTSLQCLAAKAVMKHRLSNKNVLGKDLISFVEMH